MRKYNNIFLSTNEGENWTQIDQGMTIRTISALLALDISTILAGTMGEGFFRTTDNGTNWTAVNEGFINSNIHDLHIVASGVNFPMGAVIAGTGNMIYISTNAGDSWEFRSSGIPSTRIYKVASINKGEYLFTATSWGLARSMDKGNTWETLNNGIPDDRSYRALAINKNNGYIFAAHYGYAATNNASVYRSMDNGNNWTEINNGLSFNPFTSVNGIVIAQNGEIFMATKDYNSPQGIYHSVDNGNNWQQINNGFPSTNATNAECIAIDPKDIVYTSLGNEGVYRYDPKQSTSWEQVSDVYTLSITFNDAGHIFLGTSNGIRRSVDGGETWEMYNIGFPPNSDNFITSIIADSTNVLYAGTNATGVFKTTNPTTIPTPNLTAPYDSAFATPLELNLKWDLVAEAIEYQIQVSNSPDFNNLIVDQAGLTSGEFLLSGLEHSTQYFWRVRAWNGFAVSGWSTVWMFMTAQKGPDLTNPANNSIDLNTEITFSWTGVENTIGYELQLSFTSDFSTIEYSKTDITEKQFTATDLVNGKTYFWRVRGLFNGGIETDWSEVFSFTTIRLGPDLSYPPDNETNIAVFIDFSWRAVNNAEKYQLQISTDPQITSAEYDLDTIRTTHYLQPLLSHNRQYFWRVRAIFADGLSAWSEIRTFTTLKDGPLLSTPENNETGIGNTVNFNWNNVASAIEYHIQVTTKMDFNSPEYDKDQIASTSYQIANLGYSNTYYWHVRALLDNGDYTDWSEIRNFRTILAPINLDSPENNMVDVTLPVNFIWNEEQFASSYWLQISQYDDFSDLMVLDENNITSNTYEVSILDFDTKYYWRVAAMDNGAAGAWSDVWQFDTESYPNSINVNTALDFPTHNEPKEYQATDYRLFGLPGGSGLYLSEVFGESAEKDWIAYTDDYNSDNSSNFFMKYEPDNNQFRFHQGVAFWVIYRGHLNIDRGISSALINDQNQAYITLHGGWNIITNPFPFTVSWQTVCDVNELGSPPLYRYDGSFNNSTMLEPYQGYYFDNPDDRSDIFVPYIESIPKVAKNTTDLTWQLNITLNSGKFEDASTWLGLSNFAKPEIDKFDYRKPRAIGSVPRVYFDRSDWGKKWASMGSDVRPKIEDREIWDFDVDAPAGQTARLSFPDIENIPAEYEVYLIDRSKLRSINLRLERNYTFTPVTNHSKFAIIIGSQAAV
ncbi:MAG: hypothetical protein P8Y99_12755, partial [Calditrichaceae bacterium]